MQTDIAWRRYTINNLLRKPKRDNLKNNIVQTRKNIQNQYLIDKSLLKVCQIEKAIWNPGLIPKSTNKFHESRK